jgi:TonB family protein
LSLSRVIRTCHQETLAKPAKTQSKGKTPKMLWPSGKAIEPLFISFARKDGRSALTEFTVNAKGYPEDIRIIGSSGHNTLDIAAKESLIKAAPFTVAKGRYEIPITFRLKIN